MRYRFVVALSKDGDYEIYGSSSETDDEMLEAAVDQASYCSVKMRVGSVEIADDEIDWEEWEEQ